MIVDDFNLKTIEGAKQYLKSRGLDKEFVDSTQVNSYRELSNELYIQLLKEYMELLESEISELAVIAYQHGWQTSNYEKGKELRQAINQFENGEL